MALQSSLKSARTQMWLSILLFLAVAVATGINYHQDRSVDNSKVPSKVEESKGFQRWITNLKNKGFDVSADDFKLVEKNEIYNTKWVRVLSADDPTVLAAYETVISTHQNIPKIAFSPSGRAFVDYRYESRDGYDKTEIRYYGLRDDKILDARFLDCSLVTNCYFDRAYFLPNSNDVFVVSEFSRNIDKRAPSNPVCGLTDQCTYTFKVHVVDLINNSRLIYESKPVEAVWSSAVVEL